MLCPLLTVQGDRSKGSAAASLAKEGLCLGFLEQIKAVPISAEAGEESLPVERLTFRQFTRNQIFRRSLKYSLYDALEPTDPLYPVRGVLQAD